MIIKRMNQDQKDVYNLQDTTDIVTDQQITEMNQILSTCEMKIEAAKDGYTSAKYFDRTMQLVIKSVLGWDSQAHRSRSTPGLFGYTKGFLGCTEAQGSSNLHCHFLGILFFNFIF
jgi:hypothetical protein